MKKMSFLVATAALVIFGFQARADETSAQAAKTQAEQDAQITGTYGTEVIGAAGTFTDDLSWVRAEFEVKKDGMNVNDRNACQDALTAAESSRDSAGLACLSALADEFSASADRIEGDTALANMQWATAEGKFNSSISKSSSAYGKYSVANDTHVYNGIVSMNTASAILAQYP